MFYRSLRLGLGKVATLVCRFPKAVVGVATLITSISVLLAVFQLGVLNDTNALIRQDSPALKNYLNYLNEFNTRESIVFVVQSDNFERNRLAMESMALKAQSLPQGIQEIYYKNDFTKLKQHFLLFEDEAKLEAILEQIQTQRCLIQANPNGLNINTLLQEGIEQFRQVEKAKGKRGTLDSLEMYADRMISDLERLAQKLSTKVSSESTKNDSDSDDPALELEQQLLIHSYLSFEEGKLLIMQLMPDQGDATSFAPHEKTIHNVRELVQQVKAEFPDVEMGITGEPVLMNDELKQSTDDMSWAFALAFMLIAGLFFYAYRAVVRPALALIALLYALAWSLGFTVVSVGHLNIISQAFVLMLLGLGIDLGIQILGRYEEERALGKTIEDAIRMALTHTGVPVVVGGGTTAVAFFTMCFNDFLGLAELGMIAGSGMIFCILSNLIVLPAMIVWKDRALPQKQFEKQKVTSTNGSRLDSLLFAKPALVLAVATGVVLLSAVFIKGVKFDHNLLNLQSPKMEAVQWIKRLLKGTGQSFLYGIVVAENWEDAEKKIAQLEALPSVQSVQNPLKFLPENQDSKLTILKQIRKELDRIDIKIEPSNKIDVAKALQDLKTLKEFCEEGKEQAQKFSQVRDARVGQALKIFDRLIPALNQSIENLQALDQKEASERLNRFQIELLQRMKRDFDFIRNFNLEDPVRLEAFPESLMKRYVSPSGKIAIEVVPAGNIWDRDTNKKFVYDLWSIDGNATGTPVQNYVYIEVLKESYIQAGIWALLAIVVVVGIQFRSVVKVILVLLPLAMGITLCLGWMGLFGVQFNPANIIALPLVIGIGVAYGIYILDRYQEEGKVKLFSSSTGKAIVLSALTTMIGFASMMIGEYVGLVSLGLLMSVSVLLCFISATLVLPQVLVLLESRKNRS